MNCNRSGRLYNDIFTLGTQIRKLGDKHPLYKQAKNAMFKVGNVLFRTNVSPKLCLNI